MGTLSGGERQSVAIARASYFGARVLILDEPTSALGVKQSGVVLRRIVEARDQGLAVIFITHNPNHAYPVGDRFVILQAGPMPWATGPRTSCRKADLTQLMAGGVPSSSSSSTNWPRPAPAEGGSISSVHDRSPVPAAVGLQHVGKRVDD